MIKSTTWALSATLLIGTAVQARDYSFDVQGVDGTPIANALIMIDGEIDSATEAPHAIMDQVGQAFVPRVLAVDQGTIVDFPNSDDIRHHVYSFSPAKTFELKLYETQPDNPINFDQAGIVVLGCNIHDQMIGYIAVADTPYYALTDEQGYAHFSAPETDSVRLWHEGLAVDQHKVKTIALPEPDEKNVLVLRLDSPLEPAAESAEQKPDSQFDNQRFQQYGN